MTRKTPGLDRKAGPTVMVSVKDAEKHGIKNSEKIKVATRRGEIEIAAFVTKKIPAGVIYVPFHFHEAPANRLTINALDPIAKIPEFKACAAKIEKIN
jgi:formate dehydrogenase major subunit